MRPMEPVGQAKNVIMLVQSRPRDHGCSLGRLESEGAIMAVVFRAKDYFDNDRAVW